MSKDKEPQESAVAVAAEAHVSERRQVLNKRLRKWVNWQYGGGAVALAGLGLALAFTTGPIGWAGFYMMIGGAAVNIVGNLGEKGNVIKTFFKKNK